MIVSNIKSLKNFNPKISNIINQVLELDTGTNVGKYQIECDDIFVTFSNDNLEPKEERRAELHKKYADIQIVLKGTEKYGFGIGLYTGDIETDRLEKDDVAFVNINTPCQYVDLTSNDFIIFLPGTIHKPLCKAHVGSTVRKAVVKIKIERMQELL